MLWLHPMQVDNCRPLPQCRVDLLGFLKKPTSAWGRDSSERGGSAWLKHRAKKLLSISSFSELECAIAGELSSFRVGIHDSFLLVYFTAFQNFLQFCRLSWLKYVNFTSLSFVTSLLRRFRYLFHASGSLLAWAFWKRQFLFFINCIRDFDNHGRFRRFGRKAVGMHLSIESKKNFFKQSQLRLMSLGSKIVFRSQLTTLWMPGQSMHEHNAISVCVRNSLTCASAPLHWSWYEDLNGQSCWGVEQSYTKLDAQGRIAILGQ